MVDHNDTPPVIPQPRPSLQQLPTMRPTGDDVPRNIKLVDRDQIPAGPIFDLIYASHMTKDYAAENMKETLVKFERVKNSFKEKHPEVTLKINDAIAKQYTTREKKTPDSQHFEGKALDVSIRNLTQQQQDDLVFTAQEEGFTSFGFGQSILHMDYRPERSFWAYENTFRFGTKSIGEWGSIVKDYSDSGTKRRRSKRKNQRHRSQNEPGPQPPTPEQAPLQIQGLSTETGTKVDLSFGLMDIFTLATSGSNIGRMMEFGEASPRERASMIVEFEDMVQRFGIPTDILDFKFNEIEFIGGAFPEVSLREAISNPKAKEELLLSHGANFLPGLKEFLTSDSKEEQIQALDEIKEALSNRGIDASALEYLTQEGFPQPVQEFISAAAERQGEELSLGARQFLGIEEGGDFDKEEVQKEIIEVVKDDVISSNPLLQQIMNLFDNNKGLFTLLGGAVGISGLTGILGGGMLGGFAAGAGGIAAARLALGPEGFAELQNTVQEAAAPVFDIFSEFVAEGTPLGDLPVVGNILRGTIGVGRENPLAAIALASGNIGAAAGLVAGQTGIGVLDGTVNPEDLAQNLSSTFGDVTRVLDALGIAQAGASSDGGGRGITTSEQTAQARNNYARGNPGQSASIDELFNYQDTSLTNDFGYSGNGVQALA
jgi:hypothetical protein